MSKESIFFIYLLEGYADYKNKSVDEVLKILEELDILNFVYGLYEIYHTEKIENAYDDIDKIINEKSKKIEKMVSKSFK